MIIGPKTADYIYGTCQNWYLSKICIKCSMFFLFETSFFLKYNNLWKMTPPPDRPNKPVAPRPYPDPISDNHRKVIKTLCKWTLPNIRNFYNALHRNCTCPLIESNSAPLSGKNNQCIKLHKNSYCNDIPFLKSKNHYYYHILYDVSYTFLFNNYNALTPRFLFNLDLSKCHV